MLRAQEEPAGRGILSGALEIPIDETWRVHTGFIGGLTGWGVPIAVGFTPLGPRGFVPVLELGATQFFEATWATGKDTITSGHVMPSYGDMGEVFWIRLQLAVMVHDLFGDPYPWPVPGLASAPSDRATPRAPGGPQSSSSSASAAAASSASAAARSSPMT